MKLWCLLRAHLAFWSSLGVRSQARQAFRTSASTVLFGVEGAHQPLVTAPLPQDTGTLSTKLCVPSEQDRLGLTRAENEYRGLALEVDSVASRQDQPLRLEAAAGVTSQVLLMPLARRSMR